MFRGPRGQHEKDRQGPDEESKSAKMRAPMDRNQRLIQRLPNSRVGLAPFNAVLVQQGFGHLASASYPWSVSNRWKWPARVVMCRAYRTAASCSAPSWRRGVCSLELSHALVVGVDSEVVARAEFIVPGGRCGFISRSTPIEPGPAAERSSVSARANAIRPAVGRAARPGTGSIRNGSRLSNVYIRNGAVQPVHPRVGSFEWHPGVFKVGFRQKVNKGRRRSSSRPEPSSSATQHGTHGHILACDPAARPSRPHRGSCG